nr:hypothetical protein [Tanacetum cinerariifolium]
MVLETKNSMNSSDPSPSCRPTKFEIPKVSMGQFYFKSSALSFDQYFELNESKLQSQEKDTIIIVKPSTSASGSQPLGNTKKDKIQRPPRSPQKKKVEAYPRTVKSSLKNKNCAVEPKGTTIVQYSMLNVNSKLICVKCNGYMLSDNHDFNIPNVINDVNACLKSKSVKKNSKRKF